jgi:hypothetical protein
MNVGDKVVSLNPIHATQMFYGKEQMPKEEDIASESRGVVEEAFSSGWGIVKFDNGRRVMVEGLARKFCIDSSESAQAQAGGRTRSLRE